MPKPSSDRNKTIALTLLLLAGAFLLKWWHRTATVDDLAFVLRPVAFLIGHLSGEHYTYVAGEGYLFSDLRIIIDRSCSGINFMVIAWATFAFLILKRPDAGCARPLLALLAMGGAYALTILANTGRILTLLNLQRMEFRISAPAHEALGAFFFMAMLLVASLLMDRSLSRTTLSQAHHG